MRLTQALLAFVFLVPPLAHGQDVPNTLILLADDLGVDMVEIYAEGPNPPPTPTINKLAAEGVLFRNAWANPVCSPTRATIQTGRYSFRTKIGTQIGENSPSALSLSELILPEILDQHPSLGIKHAAFGKWHLSNSITAANDAGFDHFAGIRGNIIVDTLHDYYNWPYLVNGVETISNVYATTQTVDDTLAYIQTSTEPWFCYVAFNAPHNPWHIPPPGTYTTVLPNIDPRLCPPPFYRASIETLDLEIARLLAGLGEQIDRTNIIFLGDNGTPKEVSEPPFLPSHAKLSPYEGGLNVPLIVKGPAVVEPGRECAALVNTTDIFSTVLELSGVPTAAIPSGDDMDSVSIVPYIEDPNQPPIRETVYAELFLPNTLENQIVTWKMIRDERYKLISKGRDDKANEVELYDLIADPFETDNLLEGPLLPEEKAAFFDLVAEVRRLRAE